MTHRTEQAFDSAIYRLMLDWGPLDLRIGTPCPAPLGAWLARRAGPMPGWIVTGCNPAASRSSDTLNNARTQWLTDWTSQRHAITCESCNIDPAGEWPDEPGLLIAGIEEGAIRCLGRRLDQLAVVCVPCHTACRLVWL